ncbi:MAG: hypothetical protein H6Q67_574 [Firmicutes bacterium]|nr:hypothetical protein [Bacillota bacterium]
MNSNCQAARVKTVREKTNVMCQAKQAGETIVMIITDGRVVRFDHIPGSNKLRGLDGDGI